MVSSLVRVPRKYVSPPSHGCGAITALTARVNNCIYNVSLIEYTRIRYDITSGRWPRLNYRRLCTFFSSTRKKNSTKNMKKKKWSGEHCLCSYRVETALINCTRKRGLSRAGRADARAVARAVVRCPVPRNNFF